MYIQKHIIMGYLETGTRGSLRSSAPMHRCAGITMPDSEMSVNGSADVPVRKEW